MTARGEHGRDLVGRTFECSDGTTRWVTGLTTRGGVYCRWLSDSGGWHRGGTWERGRGLEALRDLILREVDGPKSGDEVVLFDPLGTTYSRRLS